MATLADRLMAAAAPIWQTYYAHPFIQGIIDGTLDRKKFLRYLIQDTQYLKDYAKVYAYAFTKSDDVEWMRHIYADMALIMADETMVHIRYMKEMGVTEQQALAGPCAPACRAYLDYMLETARTGDVKAGVVSVMACALSYYYIGKYVLAEAERRGTLQGNYFRDWIESYAGDMYGRIYHSSYDLCNKVGTDLTTEEENKLTAIFLRCCAYESDFWDMAFEGAGPDKLP